MTKQRVFSIAIGLACALSVSACSTELERACTAGQGMNGMTPALTCQAATVERAQQHDALMTGLGVALVGAVAAVAVVDAVTPQTNYYVAPPETVYVVPR